MSDEQFYPITSLHKDDLRDLFRDVRTGRLPAKIARKIDALSDADMRQMASRLADAFCNCCYWDALRAILESYSPVEGCCSTEVFASEPKSPQGFKQKQEAIK